MENYNQLLSIAIKAAVLAGKEIKNVYAREFSVELKDDKSPLTEADKKSHYKIVEILKETGLPLLSEEGREIPFAERSKWGIFWLIDPLDGTKEFIKRNGEFTVNIALIKNGVAILGVIYAPIIETLYFGAAGTGSYKAETDIEYLTHIIQTPHVADRLISASRRLPIKNENRPFTVVASRSHLSEETSVFIDGLKQKHTDLQLISKGSSLKLCLVAEGAADVYPRFAPTMEWDTAAGQAIALSAGFSVVNAEDQSPVVYNKSNLLNPWFIVQ